MPSLDEAENDDFINPNGLTQAEMCLKYNGYYHKYIAKDDQTIYIPQICRQTDSVYCHPFKAYKCHNITHNYD